MKLTRVGVDLAKQVFQVHGEDRTERPVWCQVPSWSHRKNGGDPAVTDLKLPEPIAAYFSADRRDGEAVSRCFTTRAAVKDEGQTHSGPAAIKACKTDASAKYSYVSEPFALEQKDGRYIVSSRLTGNFPGSPGDLRFVFRLERGKIAHLKIAS